MYVLCGNRIYTCERNPKREAITVQLHGEDDRLIRCYWSQEIGENVRNIYSGKNTYIQIAQNFRLTHTCDEKTLHFREKLRTLQSTQTL